jgi:hypothetical protein
MRASLRLAAVVPLLLAIGCGDDVNGMTGGSSGTAGAGGTGGVDAPHIDAPMMMVDANLSCAGLSETCSAGGQCCSGICDNLTHQCAMGMCSGVGGFCTLNTDCCNLNCVGNACGGTACIQDTQACTGNTQCCSGNCVNSVCTAVNPTGCTTLGNSCAAGDAAIGSNNCCSQNCQNSTCVRTSGCQASGDVCFRNGDCCTGVCNIANGAIAGICIDPSTPGVGGCGVDGQPCAGDADCCSRECVPTVYGGYACQVASGCRVEGDVCRMDSDCCSGQLSTPFPGACELDTTVSPPIGRCREPPGSICQGTPEGNVCGGGPNTDGGGGVARNNCCHPDLAGVYRCFGGSTTTCPNGYDGTPNCCIAVGGQCRFSAECCNGEPCVPGSDGVLRCGTMCIQQGGVCTSTGDCCAGLICNIPPGSATGTCGAGTPTPDGGVVSDGGIDAPVVDAAPMCSLAGQMCNPSQPCCSPLNCINVATGTSCTSTSQTCSCVIP